MNQLNVRENQFGSIRTTYNIIFRIHLVAFTKNLLVAQMFELVRVGLNKLFGEINQLNGDYASI